MRTIVVLIFSVVFSPFVVNANALDYWRDDPRSYEYCTNFMPIAGSLLGGAAGTALAVGTGGLGAVATLSLAMTGSAAGVVFCDAFHKKFDASTLDDGGIRILSNPTYYARTLALPGTIDPGFLLPYSAFKLLSGGIDMMAKDLGGDVFEAGSRTAAVSNTHAAPREAPKNEESQMKAVAGGGGGGGGGGAESTPQENTKEGQNKKVEKQAARAEVAGLVVSPNGETVAQAKFRLFDSMGKNPDPEQYEFRYTERSGRLEFPPLPNGHFTLTIVCEMHCLFGDTFARLTVDDEYEGLYAKWSKTLSVEVTGTDVWLGNIVLVREK